MKEIQGNFRADSLGSGLLAGRQIMTLLAHAAQKRRLRTIGAKAETMPSFQHNSSLIHSSI